MQQKRVYLLLAALCAGAVLALGSLNSGPPALPAVATGDPSVVTGIDNLVAFWTFGEPAGAERLSTGTDEGYPLSEVGGEIPRVDGGPYSGYCAELDGTRYFSLSYDQTGALNIAGPDAEVTVFAVVRIVNLRQSRTIAGMWSEGEGPDDDTGSRQYALLMNMPMYGGPRKLTPYISSEGGVTRRADGTRFPWCVDYAATHAKCSLRPGRTPAPAFVEAAVAAHRRGRVVPESPTR